jgi:hypothetical protein
MENQPKFGNLNFRIFTFTFAGWSEGASKVVIFATDAPFHIAGDGKVTYFSPQSYMLIKLKILSFSAWGDYST